MDNFDRSFRTETEMLGKMIQPDQNPPPDWLDFLIKWASIAFAGACGSFVSQLYRKNAHLNFPQRVMEWVGGALCSIYGTEIVANTIYHLLDKFDLIDKTYIMPEKIFGFSGFLCGVLGVKIIMRCLNTVKYFYKTK